MITEFEQIRSMFIDISKSIKEDVNVYLIGGGALMYHKSKDLTKDIDIVVRTDKEYDAVRNAFANLGFASDIPEGAYGRLSIPGILTHGDFRVDLFCREVCGKFSLSEGMVKRARTIERFGTVALHACSVEDILLFKCMTERQGDLNDCVRINLGHVIDWDIVLNEAQEQSRTGQDVWITWITVRLEDLEDAGIRVPIMKDMRDLSDRYIEKWERSLISRNPGKF